MSQKYTLASNTNAADRVASTQGALVHLSDGTPVFIYYDGTSAKLAYTDRSTVTTIATLPSGVAGTFTPSGPFGLARDASDNLYVVGQGNNTADVTTQGYVKGTGLTWTPATAVELGIAHAFTAVRLLWCNTGGGTNGKGHLALCSMDSSGVTAVTAVNAGKVLLGTQIVGDFVNRTIVATGVASSWNFDIAPDGFGVKNGLVAASSSTTALTMASWAINAFGGVTVSAIATTLTTGTQTTSTKAVVVRTASNLYVVLFPSATTSGKVTAARYSSTAQLTAGVDYSAAGITPATTQSWAAFADPLAANKVWVLYESGALAFSRIGATVASNVTWDAAATADDTAVGAGGTDSTLRAVKQPVATSVDWQAHNVNGTTRSLVGDYTYFDSPPNAPTLNDPPNSAIIDYTAASTFDWTFSDPDPGDTQSKYDLQYRPVGSGSWTTVTATSTTPSRTFAASTFTAGDYEWQVRTYDAGGVVGPWSASSFFTAALAPAAPTITAPTAGSTIATTPSTVTWSSPSQTDYEVRRVADSAGVMADPTVPANVYYDAAVTDSVSRSASVPFETNNRYEWVQVRIKSGGIWSSWASARVQVLYNAPPVPTLALTAVDGTTDSDPPRIMVAITNPAPGSGEVATVSNDIYRSDDGQVTWIRVATGVAPNATWTDYTPASGTDYQYRVQAISATATTTWSAWTGTATLIGSFGYGY